MTTTRTGVPAGPWTLDDLDAFPESPTTHYELIDGALLVNAEASLQHQRVAGRLFRLLLDTAPPDFEVFPPIDVRLSPTRQIAPDVSVVQRQDTAGRRLAGLPLLVVEVQSPSTRLTDLTLKRLALEEAGVPSYWLVDPDRLMLTVLELTDGRYAEVARVGPGERFEASRPFAVTVRPGELAG